MNPAQFRLLLAGPKVSRLLPFFTARGYVADAAITGEEALEHMRTAPRHVLLVELDLEDMLLADLLDVSRRENLAGAVILMDDPAKSGLIVASLLRGIDGYIATPPDELYMFRLIERQLLAQWALAHQAAGDAEKQRLEEDKQRVEKSLQMERAKVTELVKEIASLRGQLQNLKANAKPSRAPVVEDDPDADSFDAELAADFSEQLTQHRAPPSSSELAAASTATSRKPAASFATAASGQSLNDLSDLDADDLRDDDDFEDETGTAAELGAPGGPARGAADPSALKTAPSRRPAVVTDDRTSPAGWQRPADLFADAKKRPGAALADAEDDDPDTLAAVALDADDLGTGVDGAFTADDDDDAFAQVPHTRPANTEEVSPPPTAQQRGKKPAPAPAPAFDDESASDLFLDLEEEQTSEVDVGDRERPRK